jgi:hypothetical protein
MKISDIDKAKELVDRIDRITSILLKFSNVASISINDLCIYAEGRRELLSIELDAKILKLIRGRIMDKKARLEKELADLGITIGEG